MTRSRPRSATGGFALIEALIALLLFSLGVLGLAGLQASLTRATTQSKFRAEASYLAQDLIGIMWSDNTNLAAYNDCVSHPKCKVWYDKVGATLPSAEITVFYCTSGDSSAACKDSGNTDTPGRVTITIWWTAPGDGRHKFSTSSSVNM